jgi:digeranylgeranylglycerophospholipid reductase
LLDVLIIGAGPVGSRAALRLAEMGHDVAVLEKRPEIGGKPCCTGIISQECATYLSLPDDLVFRKANGAKMFSPSHQLRVQRPQTQALIVDRPAFDRWMAGKAQSAGAKYHLFCRAENISQGKGRVSIEVNGNSSSPRFEARAVILADGFNSALAKQSGLGQPGYFVAGAQAEVGLSEVEEVEVYFDQILAPGFFAWIVPTSKQRGLVGLLSQRSAGQKLKEWIKGLQEKGRVVDGDFEVRYGGIPLKPLKTTYADRLLVVGDAAGQAKPTTGGGLYFGLLAADLAAETLHKCLIEDQLSARSLSLYQKNWHKKLKSELLAEYLARRLYKYLDNQRLDQIFVRLNSSGIVDQILEDDSWAFDWHGHAILKALRLVVARRAGAWLGKGAGLNRLFARKQN